MHRIPLSRSARSFLAFFLLGPMCTVTGCAEDPTAGLGVETARVDLGGVRVGAFEETSIRLRNRGEERVQARFSLTGDPDFHLPGGSRVDVPAGERRDVVVRFAPRARGEQTTVVSVRTCETCEGHTTQLRGAGLAPRLVATAQTLDFGTVNQHARRQLTVLLRNEGDAEATLSRLALLSAADAFELEAPAAPFTLPPDGSVSLEVAFTPAQPGAHEAELIWQADDPAEPSGSVAIAGRGRAAPSLEPVGRLELGEAMVAVPARQTLVLGRNVGDVALNVVGLEAEGAAFEVTSAELPASVEPGERLEVELQLTPPGLGLHEGVLRIGSDDPEQPEVTVALIGEGVGPLPCNLTLSDETIDFGAVSPFLAYRRALTVTNASPDAACVLDGIRLSPGEATRVSLDNGAADALELPPGASRRLVVRLEGASSRSEPNAVEVLTTNPSSRRSIPIRRYQVPSDAVVPTRVDMVVGAACGEVRRELCLYNGYSQPRPVRSIAMTGSTRFRVEGLQPGLEVPAGSRICGEVVFSSAQSAGEGTRENALLEIDWGYDVVPWRIPLVAEVEATVTERFVQHEGPVDLILIPDSQTPLSYRLTEHLADLVQPAEDRAIAWNAGVVATDCQRGCGVLRPLDQAEEALVTSAQPNRFEQLALGIDDAFHASYIEQPLLAAFEAFGGAGQLAHPRLLRSEAQLGILAVMEQGDQSSESADFVLDWLQALKSDPNAVMVSAVAGDVPDGCSGPNGSLSPAPKLQALAALTGGVFGSGCTEDWSTELGRVGDRIFGGRAAFILRNTPEPATLGVSVDGTPAPAGSWRWDPGANAVEFLDVMRPAPGQTVEVSYAPACARP